MTKKQITNMFYFLAIAALFTYLAYSKGLIFTDFKSISPQQAYTLLKEDKEVALLDVRSPEEFSQEHIAGATLIPVQELSASLSKLQDVKNKKIIVYCHSGMRSVAASRILVTNGFTPLNVTGGISQWKSEGLGVVH